MKEPEVKVVVNKTRQEILAMSGPELRSLLTFPNGQQRPGIQDEVNRILQGEANQ